MLPPPTARRLIEARSDPDWQSNTRGIYADFSDGRNAPRYYCKCPHCGYVHGDYKTFEQAFYKRPCPLCQRKQGLKLQKEVQKSVQPERKKPRDTFRLRVESIVRALLGQ